MPSALITIATCALIVMFVGGFIASFRANNRMMKRRQASGYRFRPFVGFNAYDLMIFAMGMAVMGLAFLGLEALH